MKALFLALFIISCSSSEEENTPERVYVTCSKSDQAANKCTRFMDRKIYFSFSTSPNPNMNNAFQKQEVQDALEEISEITQLGTGYFTFEEIDPILIEPVTDEDNSSGFRSFIQIWPDDEFIDFANEFGYVPDENAITVLNTSNKRQFYMIIRSSCFIANDTRCSQDAGATMGTNAIRALVARQLGSLVGIPMDCSTSINRTMCPFFPRDEQWTLSEKQYWQANFNNSLETISNNPDFYRELTLE